MTKYRMYVLRLRGDSQLVKALGEYLPKQTEQLARAREIQEAIDTLFHGKVELEILSIKKAAREVKRL